MSAVRIHTWPSLLIATTNAGKIREILDALNGVPAKLLTLADVPELPAPDETASTCAGNALIKARAYSYATGLPTVAEDSGLVIDALHGRPGVESARYPGDTFEEKFANLYRELEAHPRPWTARFVCALTFVRAAAAPASWNAGLTGPREDDGTPPQFTCEATVEGEIAPAPRGSQGFGYDPIFFHPPFGATLGEVSDERKLAVSHRGKAFGEFRRWLEG